MLLENTRSLHITDALILRKTNYSESSLITAALTFDRGQQHFIFKGARKSSKKLFPVADLFRRLRIIYKPSAKSDLNTVRDAEIIYTNDTIARNADNFATALWLSKFILKNTKADVSVPNVFQALNIAFVRLSPNGTDTPLSIIMAVCFVMLSDNGLLPEYSEDVGYQTEFEKMINFALSLTFPVPSYSDSVWQELWNWTHQFILQHTHLSLPERPPFLTFKSGTKS